ncbi:unnamed protein product [Caenorhabditis auriculariae]|uniref:Homeobox domain-containing protein n=1 Tax=Caenorhabditis auriculariae TaxID=2777116 RepID=A0A8S1GMJ5_9PELO|nr:unnamed protein product [Caenorhabditis auriculariae]
MMAFTPSTPFNQVITSSLDEDDGACADPIRFSAASGSNLFAQFPFPVVNQVAAQAAAMAQATMAQAQAGALNYAVMFPPGMAQPEMMSMGGGRFPNLLMEGPAGFHPYGLDSVRRKNATRETTAPLKAWLNEHRKNPYPTKNDKILLAVMTRMTLTQVSTWFANARRRLKKENKMTWSPQNRRGEDGEEDDDDLVDNDVIDRPSSSNSIGSDRKDDLDSSILRPKLEMSSPTPSGDSSEDATTPKKSKIWSIADVAEKVESKEDKKDAPLSGNQNGNDQTNAYMAQQAAMQQQMMAMVRMHPQMFAAMRVAASASVAPPTTSQPMIFNPFALFGFAGSTPVPGLHGLLKTAEPSRAESSPGSASGREDGAASSASSPRESSPGEPAVETSTSSS